MKIQGFKMSQKLFYFSMMNNIDWVVCITVDKMIRKFICEFKFSIHLWELCFLYQVLDRLISKKEIVVVHWYS